MDDPNNPGGVGTRANHYASEWVAVRWREAGRYEVIGIALDRAEAQKIAAQHTNALVLFRAVKLTRAER